MLPMNCCLKLDIHHVNSFHAFLIKQMLRWCWSPLWALHVLIFQKQQRTPQSFRQWLEAVIAQQWKIYPFANLFPCFANRSSRLNKSSKCMNLICCNLIVWLGQKTKFFQWVYLKAPLRDAFPFQNGWIFGKVPKGGGGHFQSKNLYCKIWTFKQGYLTMKLIQRGLFRLCFSTIVLIKIKTRYILKKAVLTHPPVYETFMK